MEEEEDKRHREQICYGAKPEILKQNKFEERKKRQCLLPSHSSKRIVAAGVSGCNHCDVGIIVKGFCADVRTDQRSLGESTRDVRFGDFNLVPLLVSCAGINGRLVRQIWQKKAECPSVARAQIIEEMYLEIKLKCVFLLFGVVW